MILALLTVIAAASEGDFLFKLFAAIVLVGNVVTAWAVLSGKKQQTEVGPQPFEVTPAVEHVSKGSFNKHLELDRIEHAKDREEHQRIWRAIEDFRSANSLKIEGLIGDVKANAVLLERIGDEVRDAAKTAQAAAQTAVTALNEAQHKKTA